MFSKVKLSTTVIKNLLFVIWVANFGSCTKGGDPEKKKDDVVYQIDIPEMIGFLGKPYNEIKDKFGTQTVKNNLGDKQVETFGERNGAPISFYSIKIAEKNGKITTISVQASLAGHENNRNTLKYWDDNINLTLDRRTPLDASGSPKAFWSGNKEDFYNYLRDNPDFGGWLKYSKVSVLSGQRSSNLFGIVIE